MSKVRSFLDSGDLAGILVSAGDGWRFDSADDSLLTVDVDQCRTTIEAAEQEIRRASSDHTPAVPGGLEGLALATVRLADELAPGASGVWIDMAREGLGRLRRRGLTALVELAGHAGRSDLAVEAADALVRIDPYSDAAARVLVEALHVTGDRAGAIVQADAFAQRLRDDLGVDPEAETLDLFRRVRGGDPDHERRPRPVEARHPRARALPARFVGDGRLVGRDAELTTIRACWTDVRRSRRASAVLLLGEPGAGKSRLAAEVVLDDDVDAAIWSRCSPDRRSSFEPVLDALAHIPDDDGLFEGAMEDRPGSTDRTRMFRRVAAALGTELAEPTVWVLDDLHWANPDTTALLTHLASSIAALPVLEKEARRMGLLKIDKTSRILDFAEKPEDPEVMKKFVLSESFFSECKIRPPKHNAYLGSMGIYVFKREFLISLLQNDQRHDFGYHLITNAVQHAKTSAFIFFGYWEDIGTVASYYDANLLLTTSNQGLNTYDEKNPIYTRPSFLPGPKILSTQISDSIICEGSVIEAAEIRHSVIGLRSRIQQGTVIRDTVMMGNHFYMPPTHDGKPLSPDFGIGKNCVIEKAIIDEHVYIGDNVKLTNKQKLSKYESDLIYVREGIIIVPAGARIPDGFEF